MSQCTLTPLARWTPAREELARWLDAGRKVYLWLRDDDAVSVTPALIRLAELCTASGIPYLIAAIPSHADRELAAFLASQPLAEVAPHGWSHRNHANEGERKQEFPPHRPKSEILYELERARARIDGLFGNKAVPIYIPPWNRIAPEVATLLPHAGFRALSALGRKAMFATPSPVHELNTHLDIIDWRGTRGGRDLDALVIELTGHLAWARQNDVPAIGILTHHLVHDEIAWRFLEELFAETARHAAVRWSRVSDLISRSP